MRVAVCCNSYQHHYNVTATHINTLQHTSTHCNTIPINSCHCNTHQHTATRINTLQHIATHINTLQHNSYQLMPLQHTSTHCNTIPINVTMMPLQLASTHCNTIQINWCHCNTHRHTATRFLSTSLWNNSLLNILNSQRERIRQRHKKRRSEKGESKITSIIKPDVGVRVAVCLCGYWSSLCVYRALLCTGLFWERLPALSNQMSRKVST